MAFKYLQLKQSLKRFGDESQPKCGAMALCAETTSEHVVDFLAQLKEFKCLEKKKWGFRSLSAVVVPLLCQTVMARKVPHWKAKLSINWLISIADRPSGRELRGSDVHHVGNKWLKQVFSSQGGWI